MLFEIKKNKSITTKVRYPYKIYLDNKIVVPLPSQHKFKSEFVQHHGCSLVGFYMAIRFLGVKKSMKWCKKYMDDNYGLQGRSKYNLRKITSAINKIAKGSPASFEKSPSAETIRKALKRGDMVLFEERNPTHTAVLLWNGEKTVRFSDGTYKKVTVNQEVKKRCLDSYYGGCVIIKKK